MNLLWMMNMLKELSLQDNRKGINMKRIIGSSFLELSEKKSINKITIANIVENCELTQPTFYRYFKDKYDMMIWIYVNEIGKSFEKIGTDKHEWKDTIIDGVVYFRENKKFLINALKHTSGRDSFLWQMSKMNIEFMENEIKKEMHTKEFPKDLSILIKIYCYGTIQFLCEWLIEDIPLDPNELASLLEKSIPEDLKPFLYK
ncbi:MAG TPA: hypothetical protein DCL62_08950 [Kandleria vitulina]|nr:hypothetical protein [Kandleria vitulina]